MTECKARILPFRPRAGKARKEMSSRDRFYEIMRERGILEVEDIVEMMVQFYIRRNMVFQSSVGWEGDFCSELEGMGKRKKNRYQKMVAGAKRVYDHFSGKMPDIYEYMVYELETCLEEAKE